MIAFVRGVMAASTAAGSRFQVVRARQSTNTGVAPQYATALARRDVGERRHDHLVARADAERQQREVQRDGPVRSTRSRAGRRRTRRTRARTRRCNGPSTRSRSSRGSRAHTPARARRARARRPGCGGCRVQTPKASAPIVVRRGSGPPHPTLLAFRELANADEDALARFLVRNDVPAVTATFTPFPMTAATAATLLSERREDHYYGAFARPAEIVALSMLRGWDEGFVVPSFGIAVDARWHGRGRRHAHDRLDGRAGAGARRAERQAHRLRRQPDAHRIYARLGFAEQERRPAAEGRRASIVMLLDLAGAAAQRS